MIYKFIFLVSFIVPCCNSFAQTSENIFSFNIGNDVTVTIDKPEITNKKKSNLVILYALPNGNTTLQTMGKKMTDADDWHFDIQHIKAQTQFLRNEITHKNIVVVYLENNYKSWPLWKQKHINFSTEIKHIVDTISQLFNNPQVYLNGHSGGGSFIFGYLKGLKKIPKKIKRISFLDSNYGYDSSYFKLFKTWLQNKKNTLNVFAYNDSVALFNNKPIVSATGGTWFKSHLMMYHLSKYFSLIKTKDDSLVIYKNKPKNIQFFFKKNPDRKIYHTQQVEFNGFIHSILSGTPLDSKRYTYYGNRAYSAMIK